MSAWLTDVLVVAGLSVLTVGLVGLIRLPTVLMRLHAASKSAALGIIPLAVADAIAEPAMSAPAAALLIAFIVLTAPTTSHLIARAAHVRADDDEQQ